jgi:hypothetical protein
MRNHSANRVDGNRHKPTPGVLPQRRVQHVGRRDEYGPAETDTCQTHCESQLNERGTAWPTT